MTDTEDFLNATRTFYDTVAEDYAKHFQGVIGRTPLERALFGAYAEEVGPGGVVADLGCGDGQVTAHLVSLGLSAFGIDLSESMLAIARREHPELRYEQGSMLDLDLADSSLAGAVSWYSSIHVPDGELPALFAEFHRVLAPGGQLLLGFQVGDAPLHPDRPWGHAVTVAFHRRRPEQIAELLADAGFVLRSSTVREPDKGLGESVPQAFLFARKEG
ncbi:class I SAM-dependent methyltransferase [Streptomyces sp. NPDC002676]